MKREIYEKWEPVEGINAPIARALVKEDHNGLVATLVFSDVVNGISRNLQINFGRVPAYTVHEEFSHPASCYDHELPPELGLEWDRWFFPTLIVRDSVWLDSFSDSRL